MADDLRKIRYRTLRDLGFSSADARRFRDQSSFHINQQATQKGERIQAIPERQRSLRETKDLDAFNEYQGMLATTPARRGEIETPKTRDENWSAWSGRGAFPRQFQRAIADINTDAGKLPFDSFGYRMMYFMYVEEMDEDEAEEMIADRYVDVRS
ncbi:MAG: hypothetical protein FVQ79_07415 [Planctomycetes bacterium]|nr:hypothetical protein [Planctomycetota bacterium]